MAYYTFSQGFRPGGFNRTAMSLPGQARGTRWREAPYIRRAIASNRSVSEAGRLRLGQPDQQRDRLQERVLRASAAVQRVRLRYEVEATCSCRCSTRSIWATRPSTSMARPTQSRASSCSWSARITEGLTVQGSSSWNSPNQTDAPCLTSGRNTGQSTANNPTPAGQCITQVNEPPVHQPVRCARSPRRRSRRRGCSTCGRATTGSMQRLQAVRMGRCEPHRPMRNEPASFPSGNAPAENPPATTTLACYPMPGYHDL